MAQTRNFTAICGGAGAITMARTLKALKENRPGSSIAVIVASGTPSDEFQDDIARAGDAFDFSKRQKTLEEVREILGGAGSAAHLTAGPIHLSVTYENGETVRTRDVRETNWEERRGYGRIQKAIFEDPCTAPAEAFTATKRAEAIFFGPGDFIEILPGFLMPGIRRAICDRKPHPCVTLIPPLMTRCAQGFSVRDFLWTLNVFLGKRIVTHAFVNTGMCGSFQMQGYGHNHATPVDGTSLNIPSGAILIRDDFVLKNERPDAVPLGKDKKVRHDWRKLLKAIEQHVIQDLELESEKKA